VTTHHGRWATRVRRKASRWLLKLVPLSLVLCTAAGCTFDQYNPFAHAKPIPPKEGEAESLVIQANGFDRSPVESNPELQAGMELFRQQKYAEAEKIFHRLAENADGIESYALAEFFTKPFKDKHNKIEVAVAAEARFYEAECLYLQLNYPKAADTYVRMLNDYGLRSAHRQDATQRLFVIANYWLDDTRQEMESAREKREGKRWFAWSSPFHVEKTKPFFDEQGRAIELLEAVRFNDIHGPLADQSLFLMGGVKLFNEDYREADYYYTDIVQNYPNSEKAPNAIELAIFSKQMSTGGADYDGRKVAEARQLIITAQEKFPEVAKNRGEYLRTQLGSCILQQAEKDYKSAEFYRRTGKPCPAYFMYEVVRRRYPETEFAKLATERMWEIYRKAEKEGTGQIPRPQPLMADGSDAPMPGMPPGVPPGVPPANAPQGSPPAAPGTLPAPRTLPPSLGG
jgi:outer membrane protein assembly factor BamD (BamD/ComL family)